MTELQLESHDLRDSQTGIFPLSQNSFPFLLSSLFHSAILILNFLEKLQDAPKSKSLHSYSPFWW